MCLSLEANITSHGRKSNQYRYGVHYNLWCMLYTSQRIDLSLPHLVYPNKWQNISASLKGRLRFKHKLKKKTQTYYILSPTCFMTNAMLHPHKPQYYGYLHHTLAFFCFFLSDGFKINGDVETPPVILDPLSQPETTNLWNSYYESWEGCRGVTSVLKSISEWVCL